MTDEAIFIIETVCIFVAIVLLIFLYCSLRASKRVRQPYEEEGYKPDPSALDDDIKMEELMHQLGIYDTEGDKFERKVKDK